MFNPMEMKYYYHDRDGELHGPSDLDFLIREVKWGGLPADLTVRPGDGGEWMSLEDAVKGKSEARLVQGLMPMTPAEAALLPPWQRLWYYYWRSWEMAFVFSGRASRRECLSVFLTMTLVNYFVWVAGSMAAGALLAMLLPAAAVVFLLSFLPALLVLLALLLVLAIIIQSFSLCWRRLHDLSLPGWWIFALPIVDEAGYLLIEWSLRRIFQADSWTRLLEHAGLFELVMLAVIFPAFYVFSVTWVIAALGLFPGRRGENRYGPPPEV